MLRLLFTVACVSFAGSAHADPTATEQLLAQNLFDDARRLMNDGKFSEACPKFAESQRLDPGGGTLMNLAVCHDKEGRLASASAEFAAALTLANRDGRKDRQQLARERLAVITPKLPTVTVTVAAGADVDGLEVKVDDMIVARSARGVPLPLDPGAHRIEATAPARRRWTAFLTIERPAQRERYEVPPLDAETGVQLAPGPAPTPVPLATAPPLSPAAPPAPAPAPAPAVSTTRAPSSTDASSSAPPSTSANPFFWSVAGLTAAAVVTTTISGILALSKKSTVSDSCFAERQYCSDVGSARDAASSARDLAWVSTISLGVAVLGSGMLLFIPSRTRLPVAASVGPGSGALLLQTRW